MALIALILAVLLCQPQGADAAVIDEGRYLGQREISCKRSVLIRGARTVNYPPGKAETLTIPVPSDVITYECGYRRARIICPIHTTRIKVKRALSRNTLLVKCYGDSLLLPPIEGGAAAEGDAAGGEAGGGAAPPPP